MKDCGKGKELWYLMYVDKNNLYRWIVKSPANCFEWIKYYSKFSKNFIKNYNLDNDLRYFFEADVKYPKLVHKLNNDLSFLPEIMNI